MLLSSYEFIFTVVEHDDRLTVDLRYAASLFGSDDIDRLLRSLEELLATVTDGADLTVCELADIAAWTNHRCDLSAKTDTMSAGGA